MTPYRFGLFAEYVAMIWYKLKFYNILHHRRKSFIGEIDIIAVRLKQLVFIEVKARKADLVENILSIKQQNRIKRSAELFLSHNPQYKNHDVRFDLIFIIYYINFKKIAFIHYNNMIR